VQAIYCRDRLGIPADRLNVNGGAIAVVILWNDRARLAGHILIEGRRRKAKWASLPCALAAGWAQPGFSRSSIEVRHDRRRHQDRAATGKFPSSP